jgi:hypothetical protein
MTNKEITRMLLCINNELEVAEMTPGGVSKEAQANLDAASKTLGELINYFTRGLVMDAYGEFPESEDTSG